MTVTTDDREPPKDPDAFEREVLALDRELRHMRNAAVIAVILIAAAIADWLVS